METLQSMAGRPLLEQIEFERVTVLLEDANSTKVAAGADGFLVLLWQRGCRAARCRLGQPCVLVQLCKRPPPAPSRRRARGRVGWVWSGLGARRQGKDALVRVRARV